MISIDETLRISYDCDIRINMIRVLVGVTSDPPRYILLPVLGSGMVAYHRYTISTNSPLSQYRLRPPHLNLGHPPRFPPAPPQSPLFASPFTILACAPCLEPALISAPA